MSPHAVQRQYVSASGRFSVVTMDFELHVGHNEGASASGGDAAGDRFDGTKSDTGPPQEELW
jgi:hypothetical protein